MPRQRSAGSPRPDAAAEIGRDDICARFGRDPRDGAGQRTAQEHPGSAAVVMDQDHRDEPPHDLDPPTTSGGLPRGDPPRAVVDDLDADAARLGPEGQLDGTVNGRGAIDVLDAVAGGLGHSSSKSFPASPGRASGANQRRTSARRAARWRGYAGQLRYTNSARSAQPIAAAGSVMSSPPGARVRGSTTNRATGVQGNVLG